jgi:hypothetical protein
MGVPFDVNETCGKVTGGFATGWERGTESEANAPEDGRILNRVYENKYFGFDCRRVGASRTEGVSSRFNSERGSRPFGRPSRRRMRMSGTPGFGARRLGLGWWLL